MSLAGLKGGEVCQHEWWEGRLQVQGGGRHRHSRRCGMGRRTEEDIRCFSKCLNSRDWGKKTYQTHGVVGAADQSRIKFPIDCWHANLQSANVCYHYTAWGVSWGNCLLVDSGNSRKKSQEGLCLLTTKNFFARKVSKFCTVTTSKFTGNLPGIFGDEVNGEIYQSLSLTTSKFNGNLCYWSEKMNGFMR